jgi:hypothetical protein
MDTKRGGTRSFVPGNIFSTFALGSSRSARTREGEPAETAFTFRNSTNST